MRNWIRKNRRSLSLSIGLLVLYLLNIYDAFSTVKAVRSGTGIELNPVCNYLLSLGDNYFYTFKFGLVAVLAGFILLYILHYRNSESKVLEYALSALIGLYSLIVIYQISFQ